MNCTDKDYELYKQGLGTAQTRIMNCTDKDYELYRQGL